MTAPRATSRRKIRPTVETETACPWRLRIAALAPHRIVDANRLHPLDEGGRPFRLARALGPARPRLRLFLPAIEARAGDAHGLRCLLGCQAVRHGAAPSRNGVASSRRFDTWGLRVEKTRRRPTVPDNLPRQAKNLNGGLPRLVDSQLSASETPFPFSILPSHMYLSPDSVARHRKALAILSARPPDV